jgi:hypothetical protein
VKVKRCLNTALFCVKMDRLNLEVRNFGTSSLQYNTLFKNRDYVRRRLKADTVKVEAVVLPRFLFHPENPWYVVWTLAGFLLIIYAVSFMPFGMLFYSESKEISTFEDWMNVYFMIDIFVNFNVALDDSNNPGQYARLTEAHRQQVADRQVLPLRLLLPRPHLLRPLQSLRRRHR